MDTFKQKHIEELMSMFNMTRDEVVRELAPNFDERYIDFTTEHEYGECVLNGHKISGVDKLLIPLLERVNSLNSFNEQPVTCMSCQCDRFGWGLIIFSYLGFCIFIKKINHIYHQKYGCNDKPITGFYKHFITGRISRYLQLGVGSISDDGEVNMTVRWTFPSNTIDLLCREFDELVK